MFSRRGQFGEDAKFEEVRAAGEVKLNKKSVAEIGSSP
jgi:hypothetical protein